MQRKKQPDTLDVILWEFVYDGLSFADEFREFKEKAFGNSEIPYIRYYQGGACIGVSNFVGPRRFLERFGSPADSPPAS